MKVIHIIDSLGISGGVSSFVYDLCEALKRQGINVSLIGIIDCKTDNPQVKKMQEQGINILCLGAKGKKDAILHYKKKLREAIRKIANNEPTICNLHLKLSVLMGGLATRGLNNVKCVETYHSQYSHYSLEYNLMKGRIVLYIPCSKSAGKEMKERFHVPEGKMCVIPNGIDCASIRKVQPKKNEVTTILSVGRLTRQKNYPVVISAFNHICSNELHYNIIGQGEDEAELKAQAINSNIRFLGIMSRKEVLSHTVGADIVCMPSLWEGFSVYMMEAFSMGRPMMLSDIPSFREAVGEKELMENEDFRRCEWGYLVKADSARAYQSAMEDFIGCGKTMWKEMQVASYKLAQKFDIVNTAKAYIAVYLRIIGEM